MDFDLKFLQNIKREIITLGNIFEAIVENFDRLVKTLYLMRSVKIRR